MPSIIDCIFCGNHASRAKEHVFPVWLLDALNAGNEVIAFRHFGVGGHVLSERRHTLDGFRFGHVCAVCNNGYLSQLEGEARRILGGIWHGRATLGPVDAYALALWSLRTAVVLNAASNYRRIVPDVHARAVRTMTPPPGLYVHVGFRERRLSISWNQSQNLLLRGEDQAVQNAARVFNDQGFNVCLGFADLLLRLVYLPVGAFSIGPAVRPSKRQALVWPRRSRLRFRKEERYEDLNEFAGDVLAYQIR